MKFNGESPAFHVPPLVELRGIPPASCGILIRLLGYQRTSVLFQTTTIKVVKFQAMKNE
jgi:hypothetical protein